MDIQPIKRKFSEQLIEILPLDNVTFQTKLDAAGLFYGNLKEEINAKPTRAKMNEHFIDHALIDNSSLEKLLEAMEKFGSDSVQLLGEKMTWEYLNPHSDEGNCRKMHVIRVHDNIISTVVLDHGGLGFLLLIKVTNFFPLKSCRSTIKFSSYLVYPAALVAIDLQCWTRQYH